MHHTGEEGRTEKLERLEKKRNMRPLKDSSLLETYPKSKRLFSGTVLENNTLFARTVLENNNLFAETVLANNTLFDRTFCANNNLFA